MLKSGRADKISTKEFGLEEEQETGVGMGMGSRGVVKRWEFGVNSAFVGEEEEPISISSIF